MTTAVDTNTFQVGDRVIVAAGDEDFDGATGVVIEVYEDGGEFDCSITLDDEDGNDAYSFVFGELTPAQTFMPGATDPEILDALIGKTITYWRDMTGTTEKVYVKPTNATLMHLPNQYFRVDRFSNPAFDQVSFISDNGFTAVYLSAIVSVR